MTMEWGKEKEGERKSMSHTSYEMTKDTFRFLKSSWNGWYTDVVVVSTLARSQDVGPLSPHGSYKRVVSPAFDGRDVWSSDT